MSSPLLSRRIRKNRGESSDEEGLLQDDSTSTKIYRDLETFQKAQLRQKVRIEKFYFSSNSILVVIVFSTRNSPYMCAVYVS